MQNLVYAFIQVVHNFGAATVVGTAAIALWLVPGNAEIQHRLAGLSVLAWAVQAASGASFGLATHYFEGQLPDIHGIAVVALLIKMVCAMMGLICAAALRWGYGLNTRRQVYAWRASFLFGVAALGAAAFLRWFS